jgi:lipopolysaccharide exporter
MTSITNRFRVLISRKLPGTGFVRNVTILSGGTALGQGLFILTLPFLTRLYQPEAFGGLAAYISIFSILSVVASLRYEQAIVLPKQDGDAANLLILSLAIAGGLSLLVFIVVTFAGAPVAKLLDEPKATSWLWLTPASLLASGLYQALSYWSTRKKQFHRLALTRIVQALVTVSSQFGAGILLPNAGAVGLVGGYVVGQIAALAALGGQIWREDGRFIQNNLNIDRLKQQAAQYQKYPIYGSWPSFLDTLALSLPVLFFTRFYGPTITGYYSLATRVLQMPSSLVGSAISQVFFQNAAEKQAQSGEIHQVVEKVFKWLSLIGILQLIGMIFISFFFEFLFGPEWGIAGEYARILAPAIAVMFVISPLSVALGACNRQELGAMWKVIALLCTGLVLGISLFSGRPEVSLYLLSLSNLILYSFYAYLIFYASGSDFRRAIPLWRQK